MKANYEYYDELVDFDDGVNYDESKVYDFVLDWKFVNPITKEVVDCGGLRMGNISRSVVDDLEEHYLGCRHARIADLVFQIVKGEYEIDTNDCWFEKDRLECRKCVESGVIDD